jgi:hypothetical protein
MDLLSAVNVFERKKHCGAVLRRMLAVTMLL